MQEFEQIYQQVLARFGDARRIERLLSVPKTAQQLAEVTDAEYLSLISLRIFRAGLKHSVVDAKWPAFEQAFANFNPPLLAAYSDEQLERVMASPGLIRHWGKVKAVRANAVMVTQIASEAGSFGRWLAAWPCDSVVDLWDYLKKHGQQLGGRSASAFLRMAGKDTFLLTDDVVAALRARSLIEQIPKSRKDLQGVQTIFNEWQGQSGRPLCQISQLLALTVNY